MPLKELRLLRIFLGEPHGEFGDEGACDGESNEERPILINLFSLIVADADRERKHHALMRKFDPWPVFFRREWKRNWPFLVGFAVTGTLVTKFTMGLTEEDAKKSKFFQRHQ